MTDGEAKRPAPWAVDQRQSLARPHPEPPHPYRTCFQRDRDRIVHSTAFRRLDFKTQVFVPHEHDHFRTRMTHTIEVAQVARTLGRVLRLNEDLIEAVALAHDLGHPPFAHAGEEALDELMSGHGGFEHNRQSLRVVDYLEHPYPQFRGLNLTNVVRECVAKHQTVYDSPAAEDEFPAGPAPLEGQLADVSDEIAYTSADLEDALVAGWITIEQLGDIELWRLAWHAAEAEHPDARAIHKRIRACKGVLAAMADDVIENSRRKIDALAIKSPADARSAAEPCIAFSPRMRRHVKQMQDFLLRNVYRHPRCVEEDERGGEIIRRLFEAYTNDPSLLPRRYEKRIAQQGLHRVACDYIAGMTDRFCKAEYERIS